MLSRKLACLILIVFLHGCKLTGPTASSKIAYNFSQNLNADIIEILRAPPLNLNIQINEGSRIETTGKEYEGEIHGLLWWKHRWQEKTHFIVFIRTNDFIHTVLESSEHPSSLVIEIYAKTYHRKNVNFQWEEHETDKNENRASEVLDIITRKLGNHNVS